jgi:hypothetical protein
MPHDVALDYGALEARFAAAADGYAAAQPFPHAVFHDVLPRDVLEAVAAEFVDPDDMEQQYANAVHVKSTEARWERFGPATRDLIAELNSGAFVRCLEALTGIGGLVVDAKLVGGGQHQIRRGGLLKVHADFNKHVQTGLDRRLNVLVYLNEPWEDTWGGNLELWDARMTRAVASIPPRLGTMVVFSTTDTSFHGHPDPLECPEGVSRKSIALYYYTSPIEVDARRTTDFRSRPGEQLSYTMPRPARRHRLKRWIPPALVDLRRARTGR